LNSRIGRAGALGSLLACAWLLGAGNALACPSCYGAAEGPIIDAARLGTLLLLGITLAVQGGFVAFFLYLRRQARRARDQALDAEWSKLQRAHDRAWRNA
jgi:hypothetical protein